MISPSTRVALERLQSSRASGVLVADITPADHWLDTEPLLRRSEAFAEDLSDLVAPVPKDLPLSNLAHRGWVRRAMQSVVPAQLLGAKRSVGPRDLLVLAAAMAVLRVTEIEFQLRQI